MKFLIKSNRKIFIISLVFLSLTLFCNVANAGTISRGFSGFFNFVNKNIIGQVKKDFCRQYILAVSSGEWKEGEFRTTLGRRTCTSYSVPTDTSSKIIPAALQPINGNSAISQTETPSTSSINNPKPDVYVPDLTNGTDLSISQIIFWTNLERKNNDSNLVNLKENNVLKNIATIRVKDMFANNYFEHNSPAGDNASKEAVKNGYTYITIGENIALGNFDGSKGLITAWMNSPGHKANILNKKYTEIGVYAMQSIYKGQKVWIAAQIFGKPISSCKEPDKMLNEKISKYKVTADSILAGIKNIDAEFNALNATNTQVFNSKVAERNTLAGLYNNLALEIKILVVEYNKEVDMFNLCIKSI